MTLTIERLKWLHDAATELSATKLKMTMRPDELLVLTSELLANREAQPVGYASGGALMRMIRGQSRFCSVFPEPTREYVIGVYLEPKIAPPAPGVEEVRR